MPTFRPSIISGLALCLSLVGCKDAPTMPTALQQLAGGEEWVALPAPQELPALDAWLPYIDEDSADGQEALAHVRELSRLAAEARAEGRLEETEALEREAERIAVLSLSRYPEAAELQRAISAVDAWRSRVQTEVALERAPELALAFGRVTEVRARLAASLAQGDTTSAVLHLAQAAEEIRNFTPAAVALRVLTRVEQRLRSQPEQTSAVERALHLLSSAREELLYGDPRRALRRALYALQLAHGGEVPAGAQPSCSGPGC